MADGGIGEAALMNMAIGGGVSLLTGGDPLKGALLGGALGGIGGLAGQGAAVGTGMGSGADLSAFYDMGAAPTIAPVADAATQSSVLNAIGANPGYQLTGSDAASLYGNAGYGGDVAATSVGGNAATSFDSFGSPAAAGSPSAMSADPTGQAAAYQAGASNPNVATSGIGNFLQNNYGKIGAGLAAAYLLGPGSKPNLLPGYTPPSASSYGLGRTLAAGYQPARPMAGGGITSLNVGPGSVPTQGVAPSDLMQKPNQGAGLDSLAAQYGISPQMVSQARQTYGFKEGGNVKHYDFGGFIGDAIGNAVQGVGDTVQGFGDTISGAFGGTNNSLSVKQPGTPGAPVSEDPNSLAAMVAAFKAAQQGQQPVSKMAAGGMTQQYAVGGKLLQGPGDGMSDSIKANISGNQEARLGDGEFVVSADVVSGIGNGSTDAGAKQLYAMMDRVRKSRTGTKKQGKQINPQRMLPA